MLRHQGGEHVNAGFYLDLDSWEVSTISGKQGGILDGSDATRYLRVPVLAMLLFAPFMGALFAIFLPFIGIYMVANYALGKGWMGLRHATQSMIMALGPSWQPSAAHLAGHEDKKTRKTDEMAPEAGKKLDELEREIDSKR